MLAMDFNDSDGYLTPRGALRFFASMLAPTRVISVLKRVPLATHRP
jgi:hypothetical protein